MAFEVILLLLTLSFSIVSLHKTEEDDEASSFIDLDE